MAILTTSLCVLLVVGLLVGEATDRSTLKALTKIPASLAFVATAVLNGGLDQGSFGRLIVLGLALGAIGDAALLSQEKKPFLVGIAAFLLSQVAYAAALVTLGVSWVASVGALAALFPLAVAIRRWIGNKAGALGHAVNAYVMVITAMVACSVGALAEVSDGRRLVLFVAAVLFFLSDICVARERFVAPGFVNRLVGLPLYYGAQLLFAWSLLVERHAIG